MMKLRRNQINQVIKVTLSEPLDILHWEEHNIISTVLPKIHNLIPIIKKKIDNLNWETVQKIIDQYFSKLSR